MEPATKLPTPGPDVTDLSGLIGQQVDFSRLVAGCPVERVMCHNGIHLGATQAVVNKCLRAAQDKTGMWLLPFGMGVFLWVPAKRSPTTGRVDPPQFRIIPFSNMYEVDLKPAPEALAKVGVVK